MGVRTEKGEKRMDANPLFRASLQASLVVSILCREMFKLMITMRLKAPQGY